MVPCPCPALPCPLAGQPCRALPYEALPYVGHGRASLYVGLLLFYITRKLHLRYFRILSTRHAQAASPPDLEPRLVRRRGVEAE